MSSALLEVTSRAGLLFDDDSEPGRLGCSYPARWPGVRFTVAADPGLLRTVLDTATADVDDLWPGRAADDGALSLVAIALQGALDVRRDPPTSAVLTPSGQWVTEPADGPWPAPTAGSDQLEWRAERT